MKRFGPFELLARLGRGGSAEVWRAVRRGPHGFARTVALKRLLPERVADARLRASLLTEARLAARLAHPNIAQVLEVVDSGGEHAIVMELVDGCDLRTLVKAMAPLGPLPPGLGVYVAHEVGRALGAAHAERPPILHRDVSATNVLLARTGAVKLADFGIGKALEEAEQQGTGSLKGNLGYMAPEQLARRAVGPAADVYAAGVLLWEMLTGRRLFPSAFELLAAAEARRDAVTPPSTLNAAVPRELDEICARATAAAPGERYADGAALAMALEPWAHTLGFGPTQLATLMRDFAPPPVEDEPARHTVTVAGATAPVVEAPPAATASPPQGGQRRVLLAVAIAVGAALGAWVGWQRLPPAAATKAAPAPAPALVATPTPAPPLVATPTPAPTPPLVATPTPPPAPTLAAKPTLPRRPAHRAASEAPTTPAPPPATRAPDLVDGKLLNPFKR